MTKACPNGAGLLFCDYSIAKWLRAKKLFLAAAEKTEWREALQPNESPFLDIHIH